MKKGRDMRLKNFLIVVNNIEKSRQFYHDLFGLQMILDNDGNMILTAGRVLPGKTEDTMSAETYIYV